MSKKATLFNRPIVASMRLSQAQVLYDILRAEIHAGRWSVGDQLPSVAALAKETGMGHRTIQIAFEQLKTDGYIESRDRLGTFLLSPMPKGAEPIGAVGIALLRSSAHTPMITWRLHALLEAAIERRFLTEVKMLDEDGPWSEIDGSDGPFSKEVRAVISLHAFDRHIPYNGHDVGRLPLVFLTHPFNDCVPLVSADVRQAYYELTCRVIGEGHRRIAFLPDPIIDPRLGRLHLEGYEKAMRRSDLSVDRAFIDRARIFGTHDIEAFRELLENPVGDPPTAIVAGAVARAMALIPVADMIGIRVPEDLSIVSIGSEPIRDGNDGQFLTGYVQDHRVLTDACFDILARQFRGGVSEISRVLFNMRFVPGDTLAPLPVE